MLYEVITECFKVVRNASHEVNAMAVANKQVDVATNNTESISRLQAVHPKEAQEIKEIWRSPLIPSDPIVWRKNLDQDAKEKIYSFFLRYGRTGDLAQVKHEREVLAKMSSGWAPFVASSDLQLIPIRQIRITSYNVCYTKLLRDRRTADQDRRGAPDPQG